MIHTTKQLLSNLFVAVLRISPVWYVLNKTVVKSATFLQFARDLPVMQERQERERASELRFLEENFPERSVESGPFKGMVYPSYSSCGSQLVPKLLGSYEYELHTILEACCESQYDTIVDIGCAEGYYAVGFALRLRNSQVIAADLDPVARDRCNEMAIMNGVADRVTIVGGVDESALVEMVKDKRCLVVSDCEGFEKELFSAAAIAGLGMSDVVIECHDYNDNSITESLFGAFSNSHSVVKVYSQDEFFRPHQYPGTMASSRSRDEQQRLMSERRGPMIWLYCRSHKAAGEAK